jgi:hypothetical protein
MEKKKGFEKNKLYESVTNKLNHPRIGDVQKFNYLLDPKRFIPEHKKIKQLEFTNVVKCAKNNKPEISKITDKNPNEFNKITNVKNKIYLNNCYSEIESTYESGKVGFEQKLETIKTDNYIYNFTERLCKYLIHDKFQHKGSAQSTIFLILSYVFTENRITTDSTNDIVSVLAANNISSVSLLYHQKTFAGKYPENVLPELLCCVLKQLKWYFLDLCTCGNDLHISLTHCIFHNFYLFLNNASNVTYLQFMDINWSFIKFLGFSEETNKSLVIEFHRLKDPLYLHPKQHCLPKLFRLMVLINTDISYMKFREGTKIYNLMFQINYDCQIRWDQIYLPYVEDTLIFSSRLIYKGEELEQVHHPERVQNLKFIVMDIQKLDLSRFLNLKTISFLGCRCLNTDNLRIPNNIIVHIKLRHKWNTEVWHNESYVSSKSLKRIKFRLYYGWHYIHGYNYVDN